MTPLFGFGTKRDREPERRWVAIYWAMNQPEAELQASRLRDIDIPVVIRRSAAMDVPDMLAGGVRELLVLEEHEDDARQMLDPQSVADSDDGIGP